MKNNIPKFLFSLVFFLVLFLSLCTFSNAAEATATWRKTYDTVMLWVNFGILVAVFLKFGRKPLMNALAGAREKISTELNDVKNQRSDIKKNLEIEENKIGDIQKYLEDIRLRYIEMGEREKQGIVDQARIAAEKMVADAKFYADLQIVKAKKQLSDEMVDMAISIVEEKLNEEITPEDEDLFVSTFIGNLGIAKEHLSE